MPPTAAGVTLVTGDTKVVDRGKGDGVFINTAGHRRGRARRRDRARRACGPGDVVILSAAISAGTASRSWRCAKAWRSRPAIESDCAPVAAPVLALLDAGIAVHCLRDLTRGGLASALVEIAEAAGLRSAIDEAPFRSARTCRAACEILGFDPLYVANEGRFVAFVPHDDAVDQALAVLGNTEVSRGQR